MKFLKIIIILFIILIQSICYIESSSSADTKNRDKNVVDSVDYRPYMKRLEKNIKKNWHPPKEDKSKKVVLLFKVSKDGNLLDIKTVKSSSSPEVDKAAIEAVQLTAPFEHLPNESKEENVDIKFSFDYNIHKFKKKSNKNLNKNLILCLFFVPIYILFIDINRRYFYK